MKKNFNDGEYIFSEDNNTVKFINKKNESFIIDLEDYEKIKNYRWYLEDTKYWRAYNNGCKPRCVRLHRLIMNTSEGLVIDHINGNKNDNRKENLRICSQSQNARNRRLSKNNKSGISGVGRFKDGFYSEIYINNMRIRKYTTTFEEAVQIRKQFEEEYFKDFCHKNT